MPCLVPCLCLLLQIPGGLLEVEVALLIGPAGTETGADERGPRPALEQQDGEDDAEAEAEGGLDEEVREAAVPLSKSVFATINSKAARGCAQLIALHSLRECLPSR